MWKAFHWSKNENWVGGIENLSKKEKRYEEARELKCYRKLRDTDDHVLPSPCREGVRFMNQQSSKAFAVSDSRKVQSEKAHFLCFFTRGKNSNLGSITKPQIQQKKRS